MGRQPGRRFKRHRMQENVEHQWEYLRTCATTSLNIEKYEKKWKRNAKETEKKRWKWKRNGVERNGKEMVKKRTRNALEMEKKRVKRNGKETLTAFLVTLSTYIYI